MSGDVCVPLVVLLQQFALVDAKSDRNTIMMKREKLTQALAINLCTLMHEESIRADVATLPHVRISRMVNVIFQMEWNNLYAIYSDPNSITRVNLASQGCLNTNRKRNMEKEHKLCVLWCLRCRHIIFNLACCASSHRQRVTSAGSESDYSDRPIYSMLNDFAQSVSWLILNSIDWPFAGLPTTPLTLSIERELSV